MNVCAGPAGAAPRWRRAAVLVTSVVCLAAPLAATVAAPAGAAEPALPVQVTILGIDPVAPQPHTEVTVTATIANTGIETVGRYDAELRLSYDRVSSRSALEAAAAGADTHFSSDVPVGARHDATAPLAPGASATVRLSFSVDAVRHQEPHPLLTSYGVYRLGVEVHASDEGNGIVGIRNTFLPWLPASGYQTGGPAAAGHWNRLSIAWLWPLVDQPRLGPAGQLPPGGLTSSIESGGRLGQLLRLAGDAGAAHGTVALPTPAIPRARPATGQHRRPRHRPKPVPKPVLARRPVPVTYAVDPALVEALGVAAKSRGSASGRLAADYLDRLRGAVTSTNLIALPYADPDESALTRGGATGQLRSAEAARDTVLTANHFPAALLGVSWPSTGYVSPKALGQLIAPYVVLDSAAVPLLTPTTYTPTAVTQLPRAGGPVTALLSDPTLVRLATAKVTSDTAALVVQQFAAETAMIVAERPALPRDVVIALPHRFDPTGTAVETLLADSGVLPWLEPVSASELVTAQPDATAVRGPLRYPRAARASELPPDYVAAVASTWRSVKDLRAMLCTPSGSGDGAAAGCRPDQLALSLEHALLECGSSAWRGDVDNGRRLLDATSARTAGFLDRVHITTAGTVTLVSQSGSIPITIANDLPLPVTVRLDITTPNQSQLRVNGRKLYVVPPGAKAQQIVQAHTVSAGKAKFPIYVQLETPEGDPVGSRTELVVRSSAYGTIAVAITAGALAVLFGTVAVRLARTALRSRAAGRRR